MLGLMVLEIYGVTLIVRRHLCSQLLLLAYISILYDRPWGQFTFFDLHNITQERHHTWSCMKGNHRFVGQLVSSVVTLPVVREFRCFK